MASPKASWRWHGSPHSQIKSQRLRRLEQIALAAAAHGDRPRLPSRRCVLVADLCYALVTILEAALLSLVSAGALATPIWPLQLCAIAFFVSDFVLRCAVIRRAYVCSFGGLFDFAVVSTSVMDASSALVSSSPYAGALRFLGLMRLLRLPSLDGVARLLPAQCLRIAGKLPAAVSVCCWAMFIILLPVYTGALTCAISLGTSASQELHALFGTLPLSLLTHTSLVLIGDWVHVAAPMMELSSWWFFYLIGFAWVFRTVIFTVVVAVMYRMVWTGTALKDLAHSTSSWRVADYPSEVPDALRARTLRRLVVASREALLGVIATSSMATRLAMRCAVRDVGRSVLLRRDSVHAASTLLRRELEEELAAPVLTTSSAKRRPVGSSAPSRTAKTLDFAWPSSTRASSDLQRQSHYLHTLSHDLRCRRWLLPVETNRPCLLVANRRVREHAAAKANSIDAMIFKATAKGVAGINKDAIIQATPDATATAAACAVCNVHAEECGTVQDVARTADVAETNSNVVDERAQITGAVDVGWDAAKESAPAPIQDAESLEAKAAGQITVPFKTATSAGAEVSAVEIPTANVDRSDATTDELTAGKDLPTTSQVFARQVVDREHGTVELEIAAKPTLDFCAKGRVHALPESCVEAAPAVGPGVMNEEDEEQLDEQVEEPDDEFADDDVLELLPNVH